MITVGVYYDRSQAVVAKSLLEAYGIFAELPDFYFASNAWHLTFAAQGIRLCVMDRDGQAAAELLQLPTCERATETRLTVQGCLLAAFCFVMTGIPYPARWPIKPE